MHKHNYTGRTDSERKERFHQVVQDYNGETNVDVLIGFSSDEGIKRNKGRLGAKEAPTKIREKIASMPYTKDIYDIGTVEGTEDLKASQEALGQEITKLLQNNNFPIIFGGGHETVYGHYLGVRNAFKDKNIAVLNFDAHFDLRKEERSSGTMFYQMLSEDNNIDYYVLGLQPLGNTKTLFETADQHNVKYWMIDEFRNEKNILNAIKVALESHDYVFMTLCMDGVGQSFAPGTSAPSPNGFTAKEIHEIVKFFSSLENLVSFDISEVSPPLDIDNRTSSLAASLALTFLNCKNNK